MKGCKYRRVSQQQKYIFLKLCITEQQSIHEVPLSLPRPPTMQAFTTPPPKPSSSSTRKTTKTTPPTMYKTQKTSLPRQTPNRHPGKLSPSISKDSHPKDSPSKSSSTPRSRPGRPTGISTTPVGANIRSSAMMRTISRSRRNRRN